MCVSAWLPLCCRTDGALAELGIKSVSDLAKCELTDTLHCMSDWHRQHMHAPGTLVLCMLRVLSVQCMKRAATAYCMLVELAMCVAV
jgi:hypothetical protein